MWFSEGCTKSKAHVLAEGCNQPILKEISPERSLEGLMPKLELQLWPPDVKNWLTGKDLDAGRDWRQEEEGTTEDEVVGWHHQLNGREFEQTLGVGDGQGSLACCSPWGHKELDLTEWLNWTADSHKKQMSPLVILVVFFFFFLVWEDARTWAHKVSWKYLAIWRPVLPVSQSTEGLIPEFYSEVLSWCVNGQACSDQWLQFYRTRWWTTVFSWYPPLQ